MLKRISIRKIMVSTLALFVLLLIYIMPNKQENNYSLAKNNINYIYDNAKEVIYILDKNNLIYGNFEFGDNFSILILISLI